MLLAKLIFALGMGLLTAVSVWADEGGGDS
jgi:hypothetical protein